MREVSDVGGVEPCRCFGAISTLDATAGGGALEHFEQSGVRVVGAPDWVGVRECAGNGPTEGS